MAWLGGMLLSGMLTVIVGRAVFGVADHHRGNVDQDPRPAAAVARPRSCWRAPRWPLIAGLVVVIVAVLAAIGSAAAAVVLGLPLVLAVIALLVYLYTVVLFAPVLIVLERLPVLDAITRSFALIRNGFWRVLGIRLLTFLVTSVVAGAVAVPFNIVGQFILTGPRPPRPSWSAPRSRRSGGAIGEIITAPFNAGVIVLLYTDRRMRAEAFDLVLQTGAAGGPYAAASTDNLWLTRPV